MEKQKIGVLTFHRSLNYGAVLQAYALVKSIEMLGYKCELIDYRNERLEETDSAKRFIKTKNIVRAGYQFVEMPFWFVRRHKFNKFLKTSNISKRVLNIDEDVESKYAKFFVGSDQVWNYKITGTDKNYFFHEIKDSSKINSYAASFGISILPNDLENVYREALTRFNKISVREPQGATIVKKLSGVDAKVVIDPSLLLPKEHWLSLLGDNRKIEGDYIVIYQRAYSRSLIRFAHELSKKTNCKLITINGNPRQFIRGRNVLDAGPIDFLDIFANAKFIVTNSFHGIAFSLNLNKNFYIELLDEKFEVNSRLVNIIKNFDIDDRKIENVILTEKIKQPDFITINKKLFEARSDSLEFLKQALKGR